jgi:4-hydroxy-3-methylbut-2-enyl diphosphate reductase
MTGNSTLEIYLAKTQGFCAGVSFAVDIVTKTLEKYGPPVYVYHAIVHNTHVVEGFKEQGVIFVERIDQVPEGARVIFSAHGVPPSIIMAAEGRNLQVINATCPLVTKVHKEAKKFSDKGYKMILIGHKGHQELIGTAGYIDPQLLHIIENEKDIETLDIDPEAKVAHLTQTTLSLDETTDMVRQLKKKFKDLEGPPRSDLCYATQNRQNAVKELAGICDLIIICGSPNSSNSNRLRETGEKCGTPSYMIDRVEDLDLKLLEGKEKVGISSGASVPRFMVDRLVKRIQEAYPGTVVHTFENPEKNIVFALPKI